MDRFGLTCYGCCSPSRGGCRVEVIMKDNHTLGRNPVNPVAWCRIAREEAERAAP